MVSIERIIDAYVEDYLNETETPFTKKEIYEQVDFLPVYKNELVVGMVGINLFESEALNETVPVLRVVYLAPQHRTSGSFKTLVRDIMKGLKESGFKRVEILMNHKLNRWFRREMHSKPKQYTHLQEIDFYLDQL